MLSQLSKPLAYLFIVHNDKRKVDWLYPLILTLITMAALKFFIPSQYMWIKDGLVSMTLGFIQSLPGFYIAALAAVATFGKRGIDQYLSDKPYVYRKIQGEGTKIYLTRRSFLCMLFAFLTYESILLILFSIAGLLIGKQELSSQTASAVTLLLASNVLEFLYLLILFQMIIATFWGLFYLGYKIHE